MFGVFPHPGGMMRLALTGTLRVVLPVLLSVGTLNLSGATPVKTFTPQQKRWWAFQKVVKPPVPAIKNTSWVRNEVDAFVLSKLEAKSLSPNPQADKITL